MFVLSTGRLLKVSPVISPSFETKSSFFSLQGDTPDILSAARQLPIEWNEPPKDPVPF